ncbi:phycobiliprotein lyase [Synechococcus sp. RSCCF101]|uniref:phycobiliprotein lyase n=1 Tax=Synechococcus sp. RSCCF101 TaxID=2511069 RepID=UPI001248B880|nr:phycobiliprotein lyase [Synechococcus sp. RSCCF101]QEY31944.1 phycobiliprotein lyase [Synechococcus sp. RSCCF101]
MSDTPSASATDEAAGTADEPTFPPADLETFLSLCGGRWLSLRSRFVLSAADDEWHSSERGELEITALPAAEHDGVSGLRVQGPDGGSSWLWFHPDGGLGCRRQGGSADGAPEPAGAGSRWQFWPDGSLELLSGAGSDDERRERIWFTKPNLRLRSTTAQRADGTPVQASFCSEIRRLRS